MTKDRHLHPQIAGSSGGFIGLIAVCRSIDCFDSKLTQEGLAFLVFVGLFVGFFLRNRYKKRILPKSKRNPLPTLSISHPRPSSDPYADNPNPFSDPEAPTPRASHFGRPGYHRQKSEEWEMPSPETSHSSRSLSELSLPSGNKGKGKEREWIDVNMPREVDDATYPIRSRSPKPPSPRLPQEAVFVSQQGRTRSDENPFERDEGYDEARLSPRTG